MKDVLVLEAQDEDIPKVIVNHNSRTWTRLPGQNFQLIEKNAHILNQIDQYLIKAQLYFTHYHLNHKNDKIVNYADTLAFWKENEKQFNILARLAKKILAIPATSASVERFFSKTGFILRPHRRKFLDQNAEKIFFIKGNAHLNK